MISITPPAGTAKADDDEDDAQSVGSDASEGGTIRKNCSVARLLTDEEAEELLQWCVREQGPWSQDLRDYPGPKGVNVAAAAAGTASVAEAGIAPGTEPYRPEVSGYDCELIRNEFLAWVACVRLPEGHPDLSKKPSELRFLKVHGGVSMTVVSMRRLQFDCNHTVDLVPYASFARSKENTRRVGGLTAPGAAPGAEAEGGPGKGLRPPGAGGMLKLPTASSPPPLQRGASYKDYAFVRRELESLVAQLRARESSAGGRTAAQGSGDVGDAAASTYPKQSVTVRIESCRRPLRLVCLSDTHSLHGQLAQGGGVPAGDVLIHCGDFSKKGTAVEARDFNTFLEGLPHPTKLVIAGNHDVGVFCEFQAKEAEKLLPGARYLNNELVEVEGVRIYGSPWDKRTKRNIPENVDVLLTHEPPAGFLDEGRGCQYLMQEVQEKQPRLHIFGHIHEASGVSEGVESGTTFVNAALANNGMVSKCLDKAIIVVDIEP